MHLQIVYPPSGPAEAAKVDGLVSSLRSKISHIASVTVTTGLAAPEISVVYFSFSEHASARRIAASLGQATGERYKVTLGHAQPAPAPGTVEIRLPRQFGQ